MFPVLTRGTATRAFLYLCALLVALSYVFVAFVSRPSNVYAAEVQNRSITMGTSEADAETTYTVQFDLATAGELGAIVVEFCDNSPLPYTTCTNGQVGDDVPCVAADESAGSDGLCNTAVSLNQGSSTVGSTNGECNAANSDLTLAAPALGDRALEVSCTATETMSANDTITLVFDNVDNPDNTSNPDNNDSFYARIYTFDQINPTGDPNTDNPVDNTDGVDDGGIAMSTAEQLTITARVQEILEFCVGTNTSAPADCSSMAGNAVDLGVLDFAGIHYAIADESEQGSVMVRTNAANGVVVDYFAEQDTTGTNHQGALRVVGSSCDATDPSTSETDQCINSIGWNGAAATQTQMVAATESFGMCSPSVDTSSSTGSPTSNLTRDTQYDGACDNSSAANGFAFDESGSTDRIASSNTVVNDEMLDLDFAGTVDITTPTGLYSVLLTFIGTATF